MAITINGTTGIAGVDGSASTPAVQGTDTNTGIFFPAADTIAFTEGGTEVARFDSSGNLGIGTTSPATLLNLDRSNVAFRGQLTINGGSGGLAHLTLYNGSTTATNLTGNLYSSTDNIGVHLNAYQATGYIAFETNNFTERARITSNGDVLLGTTATWGTTNGRSVFISNNADSQTLRISNGDTGSSPYGLIGFFRNQGALIARISTDGSSVAYNTTSDYRLKENVIPMTGALEKVAQLNPVTYTWKATGKSSQGFIAHELAEVVPDCVSGDKDAVNEDGSIDPQGVDTSFLVATLTAAIQELNAKVETLEAQNAAFEARFAALEAK